MNPFPHNGVTAHRGNSGEFPENTMAALRSAVELGADWVEVDVLATRDGVLVLSHDATTGRTGDRDLTIAESTFAELRTVDVSAGFGGGPARVPSLAEALEFFAARKRTRLSIQPKADVLDAVFRAVDEAGARRLVGFNDGSLPLMRRVKAWDARVPVFWDRHDYTNEAELDADIATAKAEGFEALVLRRDTVTPRRVARIAAAGLEPGAWTVNAPEEMRALRAAGVRRLYTDHPARALRLAMPGR
jgi:Glycerophosphoryl diester phosphodiesterase